MGPPCGRVHRPRVPAHLERQIDQNLKSADIVLLLVSSDFIASDYCFDVEMTLALERHAAGDACVIAVILRDCSWQKAPFAQLQVLPKDGKPVNQWDDRDTAWRDVADGVEKAIDELRQRQLQKKLRV